MADEFKLASAFVEVNLRDNTGGDEKQIRARLEGSGPIDLKTALQDPENVRLIKDKIEAGPAAKIRADVDVDDSALAKVKADAEKAGTEAGDGFTKGSSDTIRKDTKTESAAEDAAKRAEAKFNALQFLGLSVGLPAAAAAGAAGVGIALGGVGLLFGGLAAMAASSNAEVGKSFADLANTVESDTKAMAAPLAGQFVADIDKAKSAFVGLEPQINAAMVGGAKDVGILTDGVIGFAQEAMPGFVVAVDSSQAPLRGLSSLATSTGAGLTDMFRNLSSGSQASERDLQILGHTVQGLEGFLGSLLANLANGASGPLTQFDGVLHSAEQTLLNLTAAGSPALGFLSGFTGAASGALAIVQGLSAVLNLLPPEFGQIAGGVTAATLILGKFGVDAGAAFDGVGTKMKNAVSGTGSFKDAIGALGTAAISPASLAVGGLTAGLLILGEQQKQSAEIAEAAAHTQQEYTSALRASKGAIDENVRASVAQDLAQKTNSGSGKSVLDYAKQYGIALPTVTSAVLGNTNAMDMVNHALDGYIAKNPQARDGVEYLRLAIIGKTSAFRTSQDAIAAEAAAQDTSTDATGRLSFAQQLAQQSSTDLSAAVETIGDASSQSSDKVSALKLVLDQINGRTPSYEDSMKSINDGLRQMADQFGKGANKADGWGKSLLNADGTVNTASKNGSTLLTTLEGLETGFQSSGASIDDLVKSGMSMDDAQKKVNADLTTARQKFIDQASAMGLTKDQAAELADKYGLIPDQVTTSVSQPGMGTALAALDSLHTKVLDVPDSKSIHTTALTDQAIAALQSLGFTVTKLPDGTVKVTANTQAAQDALTQYLAKTNASNATTTVFGNTAPALGKVQDWKDVTTSTTATTTTYTHTDPATGAVTAWTFNTNGTGATTTTYSNPNPAYGAVGTWRQNTDGTWATVNVGANTGPARSAVQSFIDSYIGTVITIPVKASTPPGGILPLGANAEGNLLKPFGSGGIAAFASGGMPALTAMAPIASVVPPNTWRVVGDNMRVPESYIPWDGSQRSKEILDATNRAYGTDGASAPVEQHFHIYPSSGMDVQGLTNAVASEVGWQMRGR